MKNFINHIFQIQFQQFLRLSFMVTCQSSELDWEVTVELPADFLSLGRGSVNFSFKSVATRNPDLTRLADPRRSPVYSDISIILSKHLVYFIHFKPCKFRGSNPFCQAHKTFTINKRFTTFTFNKMPLQKY